MANQWVERVFRHDEIRHRFFKKVAVFLFFALIVTKALDVCPSFTSAQEPDEQQRTVELHSKNSWTCLDGTPIKSGWSFEDGLIRLSQRGADQTELPGGHIITTEEFEDFELEFEWKIAKNGNSGIKYMVQKYGYRHLGLEYQIYDDKGKQKVQAKNSTGAIYDLVAPDSDKPLKPVGEWNRSKIVVQGTTIQHWLNGQLITEATMYDKEWQATIDASKFSDVPDFCKRRRGQLMLTDHGSDAWYRFVSFRGVAHKKNP